MGMVWCKMYEEWQVHVGMCACLFLWIYLNRSDKIESVTERKIQIFRE